MPSNTVRVLRGGGMMYYIQGIISKVYYCVTNDREIAEEHLKTAKKYHPDEDWVLIEE